jgi:hypothetical protein
MYEILVPKLKEFLRILFLYSEYTRVISKNGLKQLKREFVSAFFASPPLSSILGKVLLPAWFDVFKKRRNFFLCTSILWTIHSIEISHHKS